MAQKQKATVRIEAEDAASKVIKKVMGGFQRLGKELSSRFVFTLGDVTRAVAAAGRAIKSSLDLSAQTGVLKRQLAAAGESFDAFIDRADKAAKGTLSMKDIISNATRGRLLGLGFQDMIDLLEISRVSAIATGSTVSKAFDDITLGIARESRMILDNQGFIINMAKAHELMANSIGKTVEQLTKQEKSQALLNQVLTQGKKRVKEFGDASGGLKETVEQAEASVTNLVTALQNYIAEIAKAATESGSGVKNIDNMTKAIERQSGAAENIGRFIAEFINALGRGKAEWEAFGEAFVAVPIRKGEESLKDARIAVYKFMEAILKAREALDDFEEEAEDITRLTNLEEWFKDLFTAMSGFIKKTDDAGETAEEAAARMEKLEKRLKGVAGAYADSVDAATVFGEVSSVQLTAQLIEQVQALALLKHQLGENSAEYRRMAEIGSEQIEFLKLRIESLRNGYGDIKEALDQTGTGFKDLDRAMGSTIGVTDRLSNANTRLIGTYNTLATAAAAHPSGFRGDFARQGWEREHGLQSFSPIFPNLSGVRGVFTIPAGYRVTADGRIVPG